MSDFEVVVGGIYQHKTKGNKYKVLSIANLDATPERKDEFPIYVTYQNLDDNKIWGSKIEEFKNRVEEIKVFEDTLYDKLIKLGLELIEQPNTNFTVKKDCVVLTVYSTSYYGGDISKKCELNDNTELIKTLFDELPRYSPEAYTKWSEDEDDETFSFDIYEYIPSGTDSSVTSYFVLHTSDGKAYDIK